jgi:hypothetical protein
MALIVEDGTGLSDANSYVSVAYADAYFLARNVTAWASLTNKEALLIQATDYMEAVYSESWKGTVLLDTQALSFPRIIDDATVYPDRLLKAVCELALKANDRALLVDVEQRTIEEKIDVITVKYAEYSDQKTQYSMVYGLISPYLMSSGVSKKVVRC